MLLEQKPIVGKNPNSQKTDDLYDTFWEACDSPSHSESSASHRHVKPHSADAPNRPTLSRPVGFIQRHTISTLHAMPLKRISKPNMLTSCRPNLAIKYTPGPFTNLALKLRRRSHISLYHRPSTPYLWPLDLRHPVAGGERGKEVHSCFKWERRWHGYEELVLAFLFLVISYSALPGRRAEVWNVVLFFLFFIFLQKSAS